MAVTDYDAAAGNNTTISGIDISEGCSPATINNAIRQMMADLATYNSTTLPAQYVSATSDDAMAGRLIINRSAGDTQLQLGGATTSPLVAFQDNTDTRVAYIQANGGLRLVAEDGGTDYILQLGDDGSLSWDGETVWTAASDGPGSGLDADTIDGVQLAGLAQTADAFQPADGTTSPGLFGGSGVIPGTTNGELFNGPANAHVVIGIKGNDGNDGFHVADTTLAGDVAYDRLLFSVTGTEASYKGNELLDLGMGFNAVGSYTYATNTTGGTLAGGGSVAASSLGGGGVYTGTWRPMSRMVNGQWGIWQRIA